MSLTEAVMSDRGDWTHREGLTSRRSARVWLRSSRSESTKALSWGAVCLFFPLWMSLMYTSFSPLASDKRGIIAWRL